MFYSHDKNIDAFITIIFLEKNCFLQWFSPGNFSSYEKSKTLLTSYISSKNLIFFVNISIDIDDKPGDY